MQPADEHRAAQEPQQGGQPTPLQGDDGAHHGSCPGDALELITEKDVFGGGHKVYPIHVHLGRGDPLGIGLHHIPVHVAGIPAVASHRHRQSSNNKKCGIHGLAPSTVINRNYCGSLGYHGLKMVFACRGKPPKFLISKAPSVHRRHDSTIITEPVIFLNYWPCFGWVESPGS